MSRGPGRAQRALIRAFAANPSAVFCAGQIVEIVFPGVEHQAKHRVSALRAARTLAAGSNKFETFIGTPSAGSLLLVNALEIRSLGIGLVYQHFAGTRSVTACITYLDDPRSDAFRETRDDGLIALQARRNALWAEWRDDEAEALTNQIRARVAQAEHLRAAASNNSANEVTT